MNVSRPDVGRIDASGLCLAAVLDRRELGAELGVEEIGQFERFGRFPAGVRGRFISAVRGSVRPRAWPTCGGSLTARPSPRSWRPLGD